MNPPAGGSHDGVTTDPAHSPALLEVLDRGRALGFLGPGPIEAHLHHAEGFALTIGDPPPLLVDLGSGAGIPGLVLAWRWSTCRVIAVEASARRAQHLRAAVETLGLDDRVTIVEARAEEVGRGSWREGVPVVVARSFASPAVTAECAAPLLVVGGRLVTSEPPDDPDRWVACADIPDLGLVPEGVVSHRGAHFHVCRKVAPVGDRVPRRVGVPGRRPLF